MHAMLNISDKSEKVTIYFYFVDFKVGQSTVHRPQDVGTPEQGGKSAAVAS
jgi:hypothetical protein